MGGSGGGYPTGSLSQTQPTSALNFGYGGGLMAEPLKELACPLDVIIQFLNNAAINTNHKIETCALLCGREEENRFLITHLIIPR